MIFFFSSFFFTSLLSRDCSGSFFALLAPTWVVELLLLLELPVLLGGAAAEAAVAAGVAAFVAAGVAVSVAAGVAAASAAAWSLLARASNW